MSSVDGRPGIAFLVPSLAIGGAERQLLALAAGLDTHEWRILVVQASQADTEHVSEASDSTGLVLQQASLLAQARQLREVLERERILLLHAYLLSAQFRGLLVRATGWRGRLVVGVRDALPLWYVRNLSGVVATAAVFGASWWVDRYVFNSQRGARAKAPLVPRAKRTVICNGIDATDFRPDPAARARLRALIGIDVASPVIGIVANVTAYKDYPTFVEAARLLSVTRPDVHFAAVGDDRGALANEVRAMVARAGLSQRLHFLGPQANVERLIPGFDIACSSSATEAFPNAVGESMACGVPCVVTDVGDAALMIGESGISVPPRNPERLAAGLAESLAWTPADRAMRGESARQRIIEQFSVDRMVAAHDELYRSLLPARARREPSIPLPS